MKSTDHIPLPTKIIGIVKHRNNVVMLLKFRGLILLPISARDCILPDVCMIVSKITYYNHFFRIFSEQIINYTFA